MGDSWEEIISPEFLKIHESLHGETPPALGIRDLIVLDAKPTHADEVPALA
jgi:hypothetical protein